MALLEDVLQASGGLDQWRRMQRHTVHLSIGGMLCQRKYGVPRLNELVAEGPVHEQNLELIGFTATDRRALYSADWVVLEAADGRRLEEHRASPAEFRNLLSSTRWNELQLAYYCGYLLWNHLSVPFILSDADFRAEEIEPLIEHGEIWRRLKVQYPPRVVTHAAEQVFHFDVEGHLRRLDYIADFENAAPLTQMFSGHQRFAGILVPTLCRTQYTPGINNSTDKSPLLGIEIFDVVFE